MILFLKLVLYNSGMLKRICKKKIAAFLLCLLVLATFGLDVACLHAAADHDCKGECEVCRFIEECQGTLRLLFKPEVSASVLAF